MTETTLPQKRRASQLISSVSQPLPITKKDESQSAYTQKLRLLVFLEWVKLVGGRVHDDVQIKYNTKFGYGVFKRKKSPRHCERSCVGFGKEATDVSQTKEHEEVKPANVVVGIPLTSCLGHAQGLNTPIGQALLQFLHAKSRAEDTATYQKCDVQPLSIQSHNYDEHHYQCTDVTARRDRSMSKAILLAVLVYCRFSTRHVPCPCCDWCTCYALKQMNDVPQNNLKQRFKFREMDQQKKNESKIAAVKAAQTCWRAYIHLMPENFNIPLQWSRQECELVPLQSRLQKLIQLQKMDCDLA